MQLEGEASTADNWEADINFETDDSFSDEEKKERYAILSELDKNRSFELLREEMLRKRKVVFNNLINTLMNTEKDKDSEVAWVKGFVAGLKWASAAPKNAPGALMRLVAKEGKVSE